MFDVQQSEAMLIKFPKGKIMLIDGGDKNERLDYGEKVIAPFLRRYGISKIDVVVLTSPKREHLGGLLYIVDNFNIGQIITGKIDYFPTSEYSSFLEKIIWTDIPRRIVNEGDNILIDNEDILIKVIHSLQISQTKDHIRVSPLVMKISYNKFSILLTSGIRGKDELVLAKKYGTDLSSTILKIPHYGSADVCNNQFLQYVQPKSSIVSVGRGNKGKYPYEKTIERCKKWGDVYRTDINGAIIIETDGEKWSVEPMIKEWEF
jgi:competence protein ComEC